MPSRRDRVGRIDSDHGEVDRAADGAEKGRVSTRPITEADTACHFGKLEPDSVRRTLQSPSEVAQEPHRRWDEY